MLLTLTCNPDHEETADLKFTGEALFFHNAVAALLADIAKQSGEGILAMPELYQLIADISESMDRMDQPASVKHIDMESLNNLFLTIEPTPIIWPK